MGSVFREIHVQRTAPEVWDAMRDYGAVHRRVAPGFVINAELDGMDRVITFASGAVARERLISMEDERRRLVYKVVEGGLPLDHHQGTVEVMDPGPGQTGCLVLWTTDFLPEEVGGHLEDLMDEGASAIVRAFSD